MFHGEHVTNSMTSLSSAISLANFSIVAYMRPWWVSKMIPMKMCRCAIVMSPFVLKTRAHSVITVSSALKRC